MADITDHHLENERNFNLKLTKSKMVHETRNHHGNEANLSKIKMADNEIQHSNDKPNFNAKKQDGGQKTNILKIIKLMLNQIWRTAKEQTRY